MFLTGKGRFMTKTRRGQRYAALALGAMFVSAAIGASARTYENLDRFKGLDGSDECYPTNLIRDPTTGNLYGTARSCGVGWGMVLKLNKSGKERVLYNFTGGTDGALPVAGVIRDSAGNLYGTTQEGGDLNCSIGGTVGCGVVFKVDTTGTETVLYSFGGGADGGVPFAGLVRDSAGNLYGTTVQGGDLSGCNGYGCGVVFKLDPNGMKTVLYTFTGGADGGNPQAGLILDSAGNLYGTTIAGGTMTGSGTLCAEGCGVVYKVDKTRTETVLYSFTGEADGAIPESGVIRDSAGNLYGTTELGGTGQGVVFKVETTGTETVLYTFAGGADGGWPEAAGVIRDSAGNLYGTTAFGGDLSCNTPYGCGVVFKVDTSGTETVLYSFTGGTDGAFPKTGVIRDPVGNLYGTTDFGGVGAACNHSGCGVVFTLIP